MRARMSLCIPFTVTLSFNYRFGSAAAQSVILFFIVMLITLVMFRIEKKGVKYS